MANVEEFYFLLAFISTDAKLAQSEDDIWCSKKKCFKISFLGSNSNCYTVLFYRNHVQYYVHQTWYTVADEVTVQYLYFLMSHLDSSWTKTVCVQNTEPSTLSNILKMSVALADGESILRRLLTPTSTFLKTLYQGKKPMTGQQYGLYFKKLVSGNIHHMKLSDLETIYAHNFNMFGSVSSIRNFFALPYILAMEAIMSMKHKWQPLYWDCYYCRIEMYDLFVWRNRWKYNVFVHIFLEEEMISKILSPQSVICAKEQMSDSFLYHNMDLDFSTFDDNFSRKMGCHFCDHRIPFRLPALKEIAISQMTVNLMVQRIYLYRRATQYKKLIPNLHYTFVETSSLYQRKLSEIKTYFNHISEPGQQNTCKLMGKTFLYSNKLLTADIKTVWKRAMDPPLYALLPMLGNTDEYRQFGVSVHNYLETGVYGKM